MGVWDSGFRVWGLGDRFGMRPDLQGEEMLECLEPLGFEIGAGKGSGFRV